LITLITVCVTPVQQVNKTQITTMLFSHVHAYVYIVYVRCCWHEIGMRISIYRLAGSNFWRHCE